MELRVGGEENTAPLTISMGKDKISRVVTLSDTSFFEQTNLR
jgi:hypothetical protein